MQYFGFFSLTVSLWQWELTMTLAGRSHPPWRSLFSLRWRISKPCLWMTTHLSTPACSSGPTPTPAQIWPTSGTLGTGLHCWPLWMGDQELDTPIQSKSRWIVTYVIVGQTVLHKMKQNLCLDRFVKSNQSFTMINLKSFFVRKWI